MFKYDEKMLYTPNPNKPKSHTHYSLPEKVDHNAKELRETVERLRMFEETIKKEIDEKISILLGDNTAFKSIINDAWTDFTKAVETEINLYETNIDSMISLFKTAINNQMVQHQNKVSADFDMFKEEMEAFSAEMEAYLRSNLNGTLETILQDMIDKGETVGVIDSSIFVTPKFFGAKGDGVTDDTAAIQAAINDGRPLVFTQGTYLITSTIRIENKTNYIFDSTKATIKYNYGATAITIRNVRDSKLSFGSIYCPNGDGIAFSSENDAEYSQYINIDFISIIAKTYAVVAMISGSGWINEVHWNHGRVSAKYGFYIGNSALDETTGWKFNEVSVEGCETGFYFNGSKTRLSSIDIINPRYGDDNSATVLQVNGDLRMLNFKSSQPFYPHYLKCENGTIYNTVMEAPFTDSAGNVTHFKKIWNSGGSSVDCGYITRQQQELFMDAKNTTFNSATNVSTSGSRCQANAFTVCYSTHVKITADVGAWTNILKIPEGCRVSQNTSVRVYIPKRDVWAQLYVNADGNVTNAESLYTNDEFNFDFVGIKSGDYNLHG